MRVFLADEEALVREALAAFLEKDPQFVVCGAAGDGPDALRLIKRLKPDVVLTEISLDGMTGIDLAKRLRDEVPAVRVLIVSSQRESLYGERALRAGAAGYVMKREPGDRLRSALRRVLDGQTHVSEELNEELLQRLGTAGRKTALHSIDLLSDRELEVFQRLGRGDATREIADDMKISVKTVEAHRQHIRAKLHIASNRDLLRHAIHWIHGRAPGAPSLSKKPNRK